MYLTKEDYKQAERLGIRKLTLYNRVYYYGWSKERALTQKPMKREERRRKYPDWVFENLEKNGISKTTFYVRISKYKWSVEKACTEPVMRRRR